MAGPGQCVMRESCASVENLVGACACTGRLHDVVPKFLFIGHGGSVVVGVEKDFGAGEFVWCASICLAPSCWIGVLWNCSGV